MTSFSFILSGISHYAWFTLNGPDCISNKWIELSIEPFLFVHVHIHWVSLSASNLDSSNASSSSLSLLSLSRAGSRVCLAGRARSDSLTRFDVPASGSSSTLSGEASLRAVLTGVLAMKDGLPRSGGLSGGLLSLGGC